MTIIFAGTILDPIVGPRIRPENKPVEERSTSPRDEKPRTVIVGGASKQWQVPPELRPPKREIGVPDSRSAIGSILRSPHPSPKLDAAEVSFTKYCVRYMSGSEHGHSVVLREDAQEMFDLSQAERAFWKERVRAVRKAALTEPSRFGGVRHGAKRPSMNPVLSKDTAHSSGRLGSNPRTAICNRRRKGSIKRGLGARWTLALYADDEPEMPGAVPASEGGTLLTEKLMESGPLEKETKTKMKRRTTMDNKEGVSAHANQLTADVFAKLGNILDAKSLDKIFETKLKSSTKVSRIKRLKKLMRTQNTRWAKGSSPKTCDVIARSGKEQISALLTTHLAECFKENGEIKETLTVSAVNLMLTKLNIWPRTKAQLTAFQDAFHQVMPNHGTDDELTFDQFNPLILLWRKELADIQSDYLMVLFEKYLPAYRNTLSDNILLKLTKNEFMGKRIYFRSDEAVEKCRTIIQQLVRALGSSELDFADFSLVYTNLTILLELHRLELSRELATSIDIDVSQLQLRHSLIDYRHLFDDIDEDRSGHLDYKELVSGLRELGVSPRTDWERQQIDSILAIGIIGGVRNALYDFPQFLTLVKTLEEMEDTRDEEVLRELFDRMDKDQEGVISVKTIIQLLQQMDLFPTTSEEQDEIQLRLYEIDIEHLGMLSFKRFMKLVNGILNVYQRAEHKHDQATATRLNFSRKEIREFHAAFDGLFDYNTTINESEAERLVVFIRGVQFVGSELHYLFMREDKSGTGRIDFTQFMQILKTIDTRSLNRSKETKQNPFIAPIGNTENESVPPEWVPQR